MREVIGELVRFHSKNADGASSCRFRDLPAVRTGHPFLLLLSKRQSRWMTFD